MILWYHLYRSAETNFTPHRCWCRTTKHGGCAVCAYICHSGVIKCVCVCVCVCVWVINRLNLCQNAPAAAYI
jgi:hypothetical protein